MTYTVKLTQPDGKVIAMTGVAAVETDPPLPSTAPPPTTLKLLKITDAPYGAIREWRSGGELERHQ